MTTTNITLNGLKKQAKKFRRESGVSLSQAQEHCAKEAGYKSWYHAQQALSVQAVKASTIAAKLHPYQSGHTPQTVTLIDSTSLQWSTLQGIFKTLDGKASACIINVDDPYIDFDGVSVNLDTKDQDGYWYGWKTTFVNNATNEGSPGVDFYWYYAINKGDGWDEIEFDQIPTEHQNHVEKDLNEFLSYVDEVVELIKSFEKPLLPEQCLEVVYTNSVGAHYDLITSTHIYKAVDYAHKEAVANGGVVMGISVIPKNSVKSDWNTSFINV